MDSNDFTKLIELAKSILGLTADKIGNQHDFLKPSYLAASSEMIKSCQFYEVKFFGLFGEIVVFFDDEGCCDSLTFTFADMPHVEECLLFLINTYEYSFVENCWLLDPHKLVVEASDDAVDFVFSL